jgi:signal transduction histidine kinase
MQKITFFLFYLVVLFVYSNVFASGVNKQYQYSKSSGYDSAWNLAEKCMEFANYNDTLNAEIYLKKLTDFIIKNKSLDVDWCYLYTMSLVYMELYRQPSMAHTFADSAINIALKLDDPNLLLKTYLMKATYYQIINDNLSTFEYINKINELLSAHHISLQNQMYFDYINKLGGIYFREQAYEQALIYFKYALLSIFRLLQTNSGDIYWVQNILGNLALTYEELGNYEKAELYYKLAIFYSHKIIHPQRALGVNYGNFATFYHKRKMYKEALFYYKKAIAFSLDFGNREIYHGVKKLLKLSELYIETNQMNKAYAGIERASRLIKQYNLADLQPECHYLMAMYYHKKGNKNLSSDLLINYIQFQDSILNSSKRNVTLNRILSTNIRRNEIVKQRLMSDLTLETLKKKFYGFALIAAICVAVLLFVLFYNNIRENKKLVILNADLAEKTEQLRKQNDLLDSLNKQKSYLINTVAHDLRNPIGSIASLADIIDRGALNTEDKELIDMIKISAVNAMNIMEDILDNASIEQGTIALNKKLTKISDIVLEATEILRYRTISKNIQIKLILDHKIISNVDPVRMGRVIMNLLTNAIKFSHKGGTIEVELVNNLDNSFTISVKDQGIGIAEDKLAKIFEPFSGSSKAGTLNEKSIGLGLSIAKKIVGLHNGTIRVESKLGVGSNFMVTMPIEV